MGAGWGSRLSSPPGSPALPRQRPVRMEALTGSPLPSASRASAQAASRRWDRVKSSIADSASVLAATLIPLVPRLVPPATGVAPGAMEPGRGGHGP